MQSNCITCVRCLRDPEGAYLRYLFILPPPMERVQSTSQYRVGLAILLLHKSAVAHFFGKLPFSHCAYLPLDDSYPELYKWLFGFGSSDIYISMAHQFQIVSLDSFNENSVGILFLLKALTPPYFHRLSIHKAASVYLLSIFFSISLAFSPVVSSEHLSNLTIVFVKLILTYFSSGFPFSMISLMKPSP